MLDIDIDEDSITELEAERLETSDDDDWRADEEAKVDDNRLDSVRLAVGAVEDSIIELDKMLDTIDVDS